MFQNLFSGIRAEARAVARRSAFAFGGAVFSAIGIAFLTAAGWLVLAELRDATFAWLICGAVYLGAGLVCLGLSRKRNTNDSHRAFDTGRAGAAPIATKPDQPLPPLVAAFILGLNAGYRR